MPKLRGVLLDLDGTLANTEEYNYAYARGVKTEELLEYRLYKFLSPVLKVIAWEEFIEMYVRAQKEIKRELSGTAASHNRYLYIQRTLELCGINFVPDIIQRGVDFYFDEMLKKTVLFPGVLKTLQAFKYNQLLTCLVTDFTADVQIKKIRKLGIMKYIDFMVTSEEAGADKPHVEQAVVALKKMHLRQEEVVMIGNNPKTDIELANRISMNSVLFDHYGYYQADAAKATFYTQNFSEIPDLLKLPKTNYTSEKVLIIDFVGTLTNEKHIVDEVLHPFVPKNIAYVRAEYELFKNGQITEPQFWYKVGVTDMQKAHRAIDAAVTIRRSVVSTLKKLKSEYTLVLLTDFPEQWGRSILESRGALELFDDCIFTSTLGVHKPDVRVYHEVLRRYPRVNPEHIAIIDNNASALSAGRDLLMRTILVKNESEHAVFVPDDLVKDFLEVPHTLAREGSLSL